MGNYLDIDLETIEEYAGEGGELTIRAMDEVSRMNIGRKTYNFVRSVMRDPELRKAVEKRKAELRAAGYFD